MATLANQGMASQMALGQHGSMFVNATGDVDCLPPNGMVFVAITCLAATTFDELVSEDDTKYFGSTGTDNTHSRGIGDLVINTDSFPAGLTIFGRWTKFDLAGGSVIAYVGPAK
jgi:hypothetical protein